MALLGVGALWVWSRPRQALKGKRRPDMPTLAGGRGLHVERTVTVQGSPDEAYRAWRDLESLPRLLPGYLLSVTSSEGGRTRWVVAGPGGLRASWEAELTADEPGRLIAWRSVPGASVDIAGSVRFDPAPGGRGTEIKVILTYAPPAGKLGAAPRRSPAAGATGSSARRCADSSSSRRRGDRGGPNAARDHEPLNGGPRRPERLSMRAVCWHAPRDIRVDTVPDPTIVDPKDAIIRVTSTAICGSDLHLYNGFIPTMRAGDILGHEFMARSSRSAGAFGRSGRAAASWSRFRLPAGPAGPAAKA